MSDRDDPQVQAKWSKTRLKALRRDNFKCLVCGSRVRPEGHHLNGWANHPRQRFDVTNVVTLCHECHLGEGGIHDWLGGPQVPCTRAHFNAWLKSRQSSAVLMHLLLFRRVIITLLITGVIVYASYVAL
jgi:hypothetical protein